MEQRRAELDDMITPDAFKAVLGRFATGVAVMTATADGVAHGMTANAVSSVSLDPPLVLVCIERSAKMAHHVDAAGAFALSFLAADRDDLSVWFADATQADGHQFDDVATFTAQTGAPLLADNLGWLDCRVWATYDGGDHVIVVGEVVDLGTGPADDPLIYYGSEYRRLGR